MDGHLDDTKSVKSTNFHRCNNEIGQKLQQITNYTKMSDLMDQATAHLDPEVENAFDEAEQSLNADLVRVAYQIRSLDWIPNIEGRENVLIQEIEAKAIRKSVYGFYTHISNSRRL